MITDPTAVAFCDQKIRRIADLKAQLYHACIAVRNEWNARGGAAFVANDAKETIDDNADTDGRPVMTGADVNNIVNRAIELIDEYEANSKAKLNTVLAVSVNPTKAN